MTYRTLERLFDLLAPCRCQLCGQASARALDLCRACQDSLVSNDSPCPVCGLPTVAAGGLPCGACQVDPPAFASTTAPYLYTAPLDGFIKRLKFSADQCQLPVLAELMSRPAQQAIHRHGRPDRLLPVPLHWRRQWRRGFNQAGLLAQQLSRHPDLRNWKLEVDDRSCRRHRPTAPQHGLPRQQRSRNLRRAFQCRGDVDGLHLAIVDDVVTTGATAEALARELLAKGARRVDVWCCARTPAPHDKPVAPVCNAGDVPPY